MFWWCEKNKFHFFSNIKNFPFFRCIQFILWCNVKNSISLEVAKGNFVSIFHWIWNLLKVCNFRFRELHAFYPIGANWIFASRIFFGNWVRRFTEKVRMYRCCMVMGSFLRYIRVFSLAMIDTPSNTSWVVSVRYQRLPFPSYVFMNTCTT